MKKTILALLRLRKETGAEVYYTGGSVRDLFRNKQPQNTDILIRGLSFDKIRSFLQKYGKVTDKPEDNLILFSINGGNDVVRITIPRRAKVFDPEGSLYSDAHSRDFTINSMYLPIHKRTKRNLVDHVNGLHDIQQKQIRAINAPAKFRISPIRMLRAVSLAARLNYKIESSLLNSIKAMAKMIIKADPDEVRKEFVEILLNKKPSKYIKLLHESRLLKFIVPELDDCYGVSQNKKFHKYDVFTHCLVSCDNVEPDLVLRLAALLHDIGKPPTRNQVQSNGKTKVTFYNHEIVGTKLTKKVLRRLRFEKAIITQVCKLIYLHMYYYEPNKWTDSAIKRFVQRTKITENQVPYLDKLPLFKLRNADRIANGYSTHEVSLRQMELQNRIKSLFESEKQLTVKNLAIKGTDLMVEFNLKEGPTIGHILKHLVQQVSKNPDLNAKDKLLELASEYLSSALK
jgi:tRNA nucleotidyltransferase (CCA-adding enzyme)